MCGVGLIDSLSDLHAHKISKNLMRPASHIHDMTPQFVFRFWWVHVCKVVRV